MTVKQLNGLPAGKAGKTVKPACRQVPPKAGQAGDKTLKRLSMMVAALLLILSVPTLAATGLTGTTVGTSYKLGMGARASALGDAFTALSDDASAIYWNPAGLSKIEKEEFLGMYSKWFLDMSYSALSYAQPLGDWGTFGLSATYLNYGNFEETTRSSPTGTGRTFGANDITIGIGYAKEIIEGLSFGCTVKSFNQTIDQVKLSAAAVDLGGLWQTPVPNLNLGFNLQNIGRVSGSSNPLSSATKIGLAYKPTDYLAIAIDANRPNDNIISYHLGGEYYFGDMFAIRAGVNTKSEPGSGGNAGVGVGIKLSGFKVDYAYVPYGDLGVTHRVAVGF